MLISKADAEIDGEKIIEFVVKNEYLLPQPISSVTDVEEYVRKLMKYGAVFFAKNSENKIVGITACYANDTINKMAHWQLLIISKEFSGKGYGRALCRTVQEYSKTNGMTNIQLVCDKCNTIAYALYIDEGFHKSSTAHPNPLKLYLEKSL